MENAEEVYHFLEEFSKRKPKTIPQELNDYLAYVARTGDPVYQWPLVKSLFKEKLLNVITDFYETTPGIDIPPYPNVDPFNYDIMKNSLLERLDSFTSAPFTVQRICELLTYPRKQYNRIDKYMRAIEKNILVVSTREPGAQRHIEPENGEPAEPILNGSDNNSDYNVDVEMEDMSWKESNVRQQPSEPQPSSSDTHITVDDIEARLQAKQDVTMDQEKASTQYESVTPPELNVTSDEQMTETKPSDSTATTESIPPIEDKDKLAGPSSAEEPKPETESKPEIVPNTLVIPEIRVDDAEMTEQKLRESSNTTDKPEEVQSANEKEATPEIQPALDTPQTSSDESSSDTNIKEDSEPKAMSDVLTSSEESSSSSDNTDGNSNSPKPNNEPQIDIQEESNQSNIPEDSTEKQNTDVKPTESTNVPPETPKDVLQDDNYSISDVSSGIPQVASEAKDDTPAKEEKQATDDENSAETKKEEEATPVAATET